MKDLISRSYDAIRKRGLINADTDGHDFIKKMEEELKEIKEALTFENHIEETVDLMTVCIMSLYHHGFDPVEEFKKEVIKNEGRVA